MHEMGTHDMFGGFHGTQDGLDFSGLLSVCVCMCRKPWVSFRARSMVVNGCQWYLPRSIECHSERREDVLPDARLD